MPDYALTIIGTRGNELATSTSYLPKIFMLVRIQNDESLFAQRLNLICSKWGSLLNKTFSNYQLEKSLVIYRPAVEDP